MYACVLAYTNVFMPFAKVMDIEAEHQLVKNSTELCAGEGVW